MTVQYLCERPEMMPTVARWLFEQFGHLNPGASIERSERRMAARLSRSGCPVAFVSVASDRATGTVSLVEHDLDERQDLSPWLAGLYVLPTFRGRGVGRELISAVLSHVAQCGYSHIYLFTPDKQSYFARFGWSELERLTHHGVHISVMDRAV